MSELKRKAIIDVILKKPLILDSEAETIADDILRLLTPHRRCPEGNSKK